jgi:hypothetical protein
MVNDILYVNDTSGVVTAVQIPIDTWYNLQSEIKKYKQVLKVKNDLSTSFKQVELMRKGKQKKQSMDEFLNEL